MQSVSVATLKSNLSRYLAAVKRGKEIVITSHRHPIARDRSGRETFGGRLEDHSRQETGFVVEEDQGNESSGGLIG